MTITARSVAPLAATLIAAAVMLAVSLAATPDAAHASNYEQCGIATGQRASAKVKQRNYNCDGAIRLIETKLTITGEVPGWTCVSDPENFERLTCSKGRKRVKANVL